MITISNLCKQYGEKTIFNNISLQINKGEKIGLIGPNGAGKSTLFHLILNKVEPSSGNITINKGIRIGYLPQEASFNSDKTVLTELLEGDEIINSLKIKKENLEYSGKAGTKEYGEILNTLENLGYFALEHKAKKVLICLGFKERDFSRPINQLSGGWQMRTLLAKLLVTRYDILLLDEPTNYLDLNAAVWLKDYLNDYEGTFVIISHDKAFLNEVTSHTFILENGKIFKIKGNYELYQKIKEDERKHLLKEFKEQEKRKKQLQRFIDRFHAQPNKASQVRAKRRFLEKMEEIIVPENPKESIRKFNFSVKKQSGYRVITLENISKSYGEINVYKNFNFEILRGEKAILVGENGAGKSTLLKILAGVVEIDNGKRILGHNVEIGYFSQTRMDVLNPDNTVLEEACSAGGNLNVEGIRTLLGIFLFRGDDVNKKVKVLSGGEKSRLILAKLLINLPNLLLLDEPTTHLDVDAIDALIRALNEYDGTIVFISHDIHFVRSIANTVYLVKDGLVRKFYGNFDYYLEKKAKGEDNILITPSFEKVTLGKKEYIQENKELEKEKIKEHNKELAKRIKKLIKQKEKLEIELNVKKRIVSNPCRSEETINDYYKVIEKIGKKINEINNKIEILKTKFL
ncbi:MAG: ATP-binding cassette domain-containing protein [Candidatus Omnitrophica bacterium]|nr:ATP-binding cassette domain-containing protein [Candidatus Omnitrophota bacterium]